MSVALVRAIKLFTARSPLGSIHMFHVLSLIEFSCCHKTLLIFVAVIVQQREGRPLATGDPGAILFGGPIFTVPFLNF